MPRPKADCDNLLKWLSLNLGRHALGALTGTDDKALAAATHCLRLYAYSEEPSVLIAFRLIVLCMQPSTREFAYHAIAYVSEWHYRDLWWSRAQLEPLDRVSICSGSPEGRRLEAGV